MANLSTVVDGVMVAVSFAFSFMLAFDLLFMPISLLVLCFFFRIDYPLLDIKFPLILAVLPHKFQGFPTTAHRHMQAYH